ncbi:MAG TPA: sigma-70 family RNA polymerase sigma factor [Opitutaceae bacterium]|jgi:RNA polymerase sigma-70 factor (ECF subfamily)|nr:sigma-70 family RNA polymerase sigma factor [Opitutaceae bacterium]
MTSSEEPDSAEDRAKANASLIKRMAGGDRDALAELYDRLSRPLFATARHILNDSAEAQDVVHDVFMSLWENASTFDASKGAAFSWAVTLTRNRSIDRLRSRANRARLLGESIPDDLGYDEDIGSMAGLDKADLGDRAAVVRTALAELPSEQQKALELAFFSGMTQKEIAEKLSEPIGTVKARIRRGLMKLRDMLATRL